MRFPVFRGRDARGFEERTREGAVRGESAPFRHFAYWQVGAGEPFARRFQPVLFEEKVYWLASLVLEEGIGDFRFDFRLAGNLLGRRAAVARQEAGRLVHEGRIRLGRSRVDRLHAHPSLRVRHHFRFQGRNVNIVYRDFLVFHAFVFWLFSQK